MKKTKLLIVIALAVLATLAMSACGLIVNSVSDIEFVKMPKTYYSTTDIATNGITIELNVTSSSTLIPETVSCTIKADGEIYNKDNIVLNATGFSTEMGEHEIVVTDANGAVEISAQYRVCTPVTVAQLKTELETVQTGSLEERMGYYMLTNSGNVERIKVTRPFVLYGEGNTITYTARGFAIGGAYDVEGYTYDEIRASVDGGLYELNNVNVLYSGKISDGVDTRGIDVCKISYATININACGVSGKYATNIRQETDNLTVNISNGTWSGGYTALQTRSTDSVFNIDSVELKGTNYWAIEGDNSYSTIVIESDDETDRGHRNVLNITNTKVVAIEKNTAVESHIDIRGNDNVVNFVNCMYSTEVDANDNVINFNVIKNIEDIKYLGDLTKNIITIK